MPVGRVVAASVAGFFLLGLPAPARANRESTALCVRAAGESYNLDRERAIATYHQAIAADPQDARAYRGLASALWLSITFRRGNMTVDDYMGRAGKPTGTPVPPPPETAAAFNEALDRALAIARAHIEANPRNADAHYQLGAAIGLRASYIATVDNSALGAFRAAREAYEEHERVLEIDSGRKDAGLIVGTYRYIVSTLALPLRWVAYVAGFGGGKERGIRLIEEAAAYGGDNQEDARFALILLYNREGRYDDALKLLRLLRDRYTGNRLVWLESGSTALRAGRAADAERFINDGLSKFASDTRPRMFGEDALWYYKRGMARAKLARPADADRDFTKALAVEGRKWVHGRSHLELGRLAQNAGHRPVARQHFENAITLCDSDSDTASADEARRLLKQVG
jgi:tetratricopeptide (TPR) repeat protein